MRRSSIFLALLFLLFHVKAQNVTVSGALVGNGSYPSLTDAFAAINGGGQTGASITVSVLNDTWEGSGTALLNAGTWASITVVPVGQPRSILGATTAGQPMIELDGADRVVFWGLLGGQKGLTLYNSTNASTMGTSTIRLRNAASYNRFLHCRILGASQTFSYQEGGNFVFSGGSLGGNDYNSIRDCELGPGGGDLPTKLVMCMANAQFANASVGDTLSNNDFVDCFGVAATSVSLQVARGASSWVVDGNRFYQTAPRVKQVTGGDHTDISFGIFNGPDFSFPLISNNLIGPPPPPLYGKSVYTFPDNGGNYTAIYMGSADPLSSSSVVNNVIRDIQASNTSASNVDDIFVGIRLHQCSGTVSGNLIGSATDTSSILISGNNAGMAASVGIQGGFGSYQQFSGNQVGGITASNVGTGLVHFTGIRGGQGSATTLVINNTVGFVNAPLKVRGSGLGTSLSGISITNGSVTVNGNTVAYLRSEAPATYAYTGGFTSSFSVEGIVASASLAPFGVVSGNTVHSLSNSHPSARTSIVGIESRYTAQVSANRVHALSLSTSASDALLVGIDVAGPSPAVHNNMVRLGYDGDGQSLTRGLQIMGMRSINDLPWYDHNSIYIGGVGVMDTASTYAVYCLINSGNRRFINNIFFNARSNGSGTGRHYAILSGGSSLAPNTPPLSNGNDLYVSGVGGVIGRYGGADRLTFPDWQLATGQDAASISQDPLFIHPTGNALAGDLHVGPITPIEGDGVVGSTVTADIDNQNRVALTPVDIGADAGNFTSSSALYPIASILGNSLSIVPGDASPSPLDGTEFGATLACGGSPFMGTFQLQNSGSANLVVSSLQVVGSPAFVALPLGLSTIAPGQVVAFTVQFMPTSPGLHIGTVTLLSNALATGTYTFAVSGMALPDTTVPVAVCQAVSLVLDASGNAQLTASAIDGGSTDNCGIDSLWAASTQFTCAEVGANAVQLSVQDASGHVDTCTATVNIAASALAVQLSSPVGACGYHIACAGQASASASANASGACAPYTYTWSNGQTSATATGLGAGVHSVTVTSADGQQQVQSVNLTEPPALSVTLQTLMMTCPTSGNGLIIVASMGGQACQPYSYLWSNGVPSYYNAGVSQGTYTVTVTDAAGCTASLSVYVPLAQQPPLTILENQGNLISTPGFVSYQWYDSVGVINGATNSSYAPTASGWYTVVVTDSIGCAWISAAYPFVYVGAAAALPGWSDIRLYPNPGRGVFQFAVGEVIEGPLWLSVTDLSGRVLHQEVLAELQGGRVFDLSAVAAGVYVVELRGVEGQALHFRLLRE